MALAPQTYDTYGHWRLRQLKESPGKFKRDVCPSDFLAVRRDLARELRDLKGQEVLELGCGFGDFGVWLAHRGARVRGIELGPTLVEAANVLAQLNKVPCEFQQGDIGQTLPFPDQQFDIVTGLSILHHLDEEPLRMALHECHRVLKPGGVAWFFEPMENSKVFNFIQNLVPIGGAEPRPSILSRRKWREHLAIQDDRPLTDAELKAAGRPFARVDIRHFGLTSRLRVVVGPRYDGVFDAIDESFLRVLPFLRRFGQTALIRYQK